MSLGEINQAAGSRASGYTAVETSWGTLNASPNWRKVRLLGNSGMDIDLALYKSKEMRGDRMQNATVRGSQRPTGNFAFELSPRGWNNWLYQTLGGAVTTTGPTGGLANVATPTVVATNTGGVLSWPTGVGTGAQAYRYVVTAVNAVGETCYGPTGCVASAVATTTASTTGSIAVSWVAISGASGYKVYGRTAAAYGLLAVLGAGATSWVDTGSVTGGQLAPHNENTTGSYYTHTFAGGTDLPVGFSYQQGFEDIGLYYVFLGNRIDKCDIDFQIDKIPLGTFMTDGRQAVDVSQTNLVAPIALTITAAVTDPATPSTNQVQITTSVAHGYSSGQTVTIASIVGTVEANGTWQILVDSSTTFLLLGSVFAVAWTSGGTSTAAITQSAQEDPYTSVQVNVSWGGVVFPKVENLKLSISNNLYKDRGLILGSNFRQNLRPGDRVTTVSGEFMFTDGDLYAEAVSGTKGALVITVTNGFYSHTFTMTQFQFLPNKSTPKAKDQGPVSIPLNGEALPDPATGTDITCIIKTAEPSIVN